jgi:hypothetical protein
MRARWLRIGSFAAALLCASLVAVHGCALVAGIEAPDPALAHCLDGVEDGDETGVDCGGSCGACDGTPCSMGSDCESQSCPDGKCAHATCTDGILDGLESAVDCGDPRPAQMCPGCPVGAYCYTGCNCASKHCDLPSHTCTDDVVSNCAGCTDHVQDGTETDVDCGGKTCPACPDGEKCDVDTDCQSGHCHPGTAGPPAQPDTCVPATCFDGKQDGDETGVDCGGSCFACPGTLCEQDVGCASELCQGGDGGPRVCVTTCTDGVQDGDETDVDCGGGLCPGCAAGETCKVSTDCAAMLACFHGVCRSPACEQPGDCGQQGCGACADTVCTAGSACWSGCCNERGQCCPDTCVDGVLDGTETGIDCGGLCAGCPIGLGCERTRDCAAGAFCDPATSLCSKMTVSPCTDGSQTGFDCGGICPPCAIGLGCRTGADCTTDLCGPAMNGMQCLGIPTNCDDGVEDGDETDVDCGGSCPPCAAGQTCKLHTDCDSGVCTPGAGGGGGAGGSAGTSTCAAPTCSDGVQNGGESDVDCGAACPVQCAKGQFCFVDQDCESKTCKSGTCG